MLIHLFVAGEAFFIELPDASPSTTFSELKRILERNYGVVADSLTIMLPTDRSQPRDEELVTTRYIPDPLVPYLMVISSATSPINVVFVTVLGMKFIVSLSVDTVGDIFKRFYKACPGQIQTGMGLGGPTGDKCLDDGQTLAACGLKSGDVLQFVYRSAATYSNPPWHFNSYYPQHITAPNSSTGLYQPPSNYSPTVTPITYNSGPPQEEDDSFKKFQPPRNYSPTVTPITYPSGPPQEEDDSFKKFPNITPPSWVTNPTPDRTFPNIRTWDLGNDKQLAIMFQKDVLVWELRERTSDGYHRPLTKWKPVNMTRLESVFEEAGLAAGIRVHTSPLKMQASPPSTVTPTKQVGTNNSVPESATTTVVNPPINPFACRNVYDMPRYKHTKKVRPGSITSYSFPPNTDRVDNWKSHNAALEKKGRGLFRKNNKKNWTEGEMTLKIGNHGHLEFLWPMPKNRTHQLFESDGLFDASGNWITVQTDQKVFPQAPHTGLTFYVYEQKNFSKLTRIIAGRALDEKQKKK
jgi:hypothetical protein